MPKVWQAIVGSAQELTLEERTIDLEDLRDEEVYVETEVTALSTGTELGNYLGDSQYIPGAPGYPRALGYCNVGTVRQVGSAVTDFKPGDRVFSTKRHQSAYIARASDLLLLVPQGVSAEEASLAFFAHLGLSSLHWAGYEAGENIVVIGLGVIGLCTVAVARAMGANAIAVANSEVRASVALRIGADVTVLADDPALLDQVAAAFPGAGADIVVLTANTWEAYRLAMRVVRHSGRVCILGFPGRGQPAPTFNPLDPSWVWAKRLSLLGCGFDTHVEAPASDLRFNTRRNLRYLLDLMALGRLRLEPIISHRFPYYRMQEAYELAANHSKELVAAVFDWRCQTERADSTVVVGQDSYDLRTADLRHA
ncbi:MAG: zinc-binding alcohol dehydrogenase [Planctomycetota bacterium]